MNSLTERELRLALVGDVILDRDDPENAFDHVRKVFQSVDGAIANCEGVYSDNASYPPPAIHQMVCAPSNARGLASAGFKAVSVANNHIVDGGHEGLRDTIKTIRELGIVTAGAGCNIDEAREAAIFDVEGVKVGLLSYTSVLPKGYEARAKIPGVAPLRVDTFYEAPEPNMWMPGYAPRIRTIHWPQDLQAMENDIKRVRANVDFLVVSVHQGNSQSGGFLIDEYERVAAHTAIDAGASAFAALGHHHSLRGAEFYKGCPVFYGLGNFLFDLTHVEEHFPPDLLENWRQRFGENAFGPKPDYPNYPFPPAYRKTAIGLISVVPKVGVRAAFVPAMVQPDGRPKPVELDSAEGRECVSYLNECMDAIGSDFRLKPIESFCGVANALEVVTR